MKTKFLLATVFLCIGLVTGSLSSCSVGGHIGTSQKTVSME
jgi:hypothetical protein